MRDRFDRILVGLHGCAGRASVFLHAPARSAGGAPQRGAARPVALTYGPPDGARASSFVERAWGVRFATARVLLAAANLSVRFHVYALLLAVWIPNRLPSLPRGGKSPYEMLTGINHQA